MPKLIVIRGNSGSGKSTAAPEVQKRFGRGCLRIAQDTVRRLYAGKALEMRALSGKTITKNSDPAALCRRIAAF